MLAKITGEHPQLIADCGQTAQYYAALLFEDGTDKPKMALPNLLGKTIRINVLKA